MNPKERMKLVSQGKKADRIPFLPTVFEHGARFIGKTPSETAVDRNLLAEAHLKAYECYKHDAVTVGIDVYNIEAEALGCVVKFHDDNSIPGILVHGMREGIEFGKLAFSTNLGRIQNVLTAADRVNKTIGHEVSVCLGICGPFSIAAELLSYDNIVFKCIDDPDEVHSFLNAILKFQKDYCNEIIRLGLGITIFESWATPPLISPEVYREFVMPWEKELITHIKKQGIGSVPLVIGGDTTSILDDMMSTGTTLIVADYKVDLGHYIKKASSKNLMLRGNIDPKLVERGPIDDILENAERILEKAKGYDRFVLGTGVIPYDTPPENVLAIKDFLERRKR